VPAHSGDPPPPGSKKSGCRPPSWGLTKKADPVNKKRGGGVEVRGMAASEGEDNEQGGLRTAFSAFFRILRIYSHLSVFFRIFPAYFTFSPKILGLNTLSSF
jgi:hypothetical protein